MGEVEDLQHPCEEGRRVDEAEASTLLVQLGVDHDERADAGGIDEGEVHAVDDDVTGFSI
jgi:hypothetical protein